MKAQTSSNYSQIYNEFPPNNISLTELSNKFNVSQELEDKFRKTNQNFAVFNESKVELTYRDNFIRLKIFPLAAAAYGTDKNIVDCLTEIYPEFKFIKNWVVKCQGVDASCSAFIAVSITDKAIVLAFRGTDTFWQLTHEVIETLFFQKVLSVFGHGYVAFYFDNIFTQLDKKGVTEEVITLLNEYRGYEVWITGHSLGGALAAIAAAKLVHLNRIPQDRVKLVTFGQPRTGDSGFAARMATELSFFNYRVVRARDLVVHIPPRVYEDYAHYRTEIFYDNEMKPGEPWKRCVGGDEDKDCANKYGQDFNNSIRIVFLFLKNVATYGLSGCYGG
uniref:Fungal lipase-like domain-containing protein n=1 Tax=Meloidogyne floridensis TaxID=298350 RepID=A0A915NK07_9BILA